jgi:hypothetical protein
MGAWARAMAVEVGRQGQYTLWIHFAETAMGLADGSFFLFFFFFSFF